MDRWLKIDNTGFAKPHRKSIRGANWTVMLSPYDIPQAVRFGESSEEVLIEFKYMTSEGPIKSHVSDGVRFITDPYNKRLYRIEVPKKLFEDALDDSKNLAISFVVKAFDDARQEDIGLTESEGIPLAIKSLNQDQIQHALI